MSQLGAMEDQEVKHGAALFVSVAVAIVSAFVVGILVGAFVL